MAWGAKVNPESLFLVSYLLVAVSLLSFMVENYHRLNILSLLGHSLFFCPDFSCSWDFDVPLLDLLGQLLRKAFENYDLEHMITAFLIARQAALEGPAVFMPYSEWLKVRASGSVWKNMGWKMLLLVSKWKRSKEAASVFSHLTCPNG